MAFSHGVQSIESTAQKTDEGFDKQLSSASRMIGMLILTMD
jgi:hypothetical protein